MTTENRAEGIEATAETGREIVTAGIGAGENVTITGIETVIVTGVEGAMIAAEMIGVVEGVGTIVAMIVVTTAAEIEIKNRDGVAKTTVAIGVEEIAAMIEMIGGTEVPKEGTEMEI